MAYIHPDSNKGEIMALILSGIALIWIIFLGSIFGLGGVVFGVASLLIIAGFIQVVIKATGNR